MSDTDHPVTVQNNELLEAKQDLPQDELWSAATEPSIPWHSGLSLKVFGLAILMILASVGLQWFSWRVRSPHETLSGFVSNVAAEFLLVGLAVVPAAWFAGRKFAGIAPYVVKLIAQLRRDGKISPDAARRAVICGVTLISEDGLGTLRSDDVGSGERTPCLVCQLPFTASTRCPHCRLSKAVWDSDELRKINIAPARLPE